VQLEVIDTRNNELLPSLAAFTQLLAR